MNTILSSRIGHYVERLGILLLVVALAMGTTGCSCTVDYGPVGETEITNWNDLDDIRGNLGGSYILMNDLDSNTPGYEELASSKANEGKGWQPIGADGEAFKGTFDGNGHSISDLFIYRPAENEVGLFGRVEGGLVENVGLVSVNVTGNKSVGALVGYSRGGTLYSDTPPPSSKTYSRGSVTGEEDVGGLVGNNYDGTVNQCESSAEVFHLSGKPDEKRWRAGGLVGLNGGTVLNCNYSGEVNGDRQVGGLVGHNALVPLGRVEDCGGAYSVYGNLEVGGVAGRNLGALRRASFNGTVRAFLLGDGLIALNEGGSGNAGSSDTAPLGSYVGGVVGVNEGTVEGCSAQATVEGYQYVGGLAGTNNGTVEDCSAEATVEGYQYVGGLVGANAGKVGTCSSSGDVTGNSDAGGLVGYNMVTGTVSNSDSTSNVTGISDFGDLVGRNEGLIRYNLTVSSTEGGEAAMPGEGTFTYDEGTVVNLVAAPDEGYRFVKWTGDVTTIGNVNAAMTSIFMNDNCEITANFALAVVIEIRDWYDLDAVRYNLGGSYLLMNDLDATNPGYEEMASHTASDGKGWDPVGTSNDQFTGTFYGQGYEIRDLFISRPDEDEVGLFGCVGEAGVINDVEVVNAAVTGRQYVAGVVGNNLGTLSNCYFSGSVNGDQSLGGLAGVNVGTIINSHYNYSEVPINTVSTITIGALFAEDFQEWLANGKSLDVDQRLSQENGCYLVNDVTDLKELLAFGQDNSLRFRLTDNLDLDGEANFYIPYLAGEFDGNGHKILNLTLNSDSALQVGLFGYLAPGGKVTQLGVENVDVAGAYVVGGLVGVNLGTVSNSYATGNVSDSSHAGGLVGVNGGLVSNCYSTGNVRDSFRVGGLVGLNSGGGDVTRSFWDTETSGEANSAGGTGKNTMQMKNRATFTDWDITAVSDPDTPNTAYMWNIVDGQTYPFLSWQSIS